jgi:hypothetical protein
MTPNEYRKKHKRCITCKYSDYDNGLSICLAKGKVAASDLRINLLKGRLCKVYNPILLKEGKHEKAKS